MFTGRIQGEPSVGNFGVDQIAPQFVDQFDPKGNVTHHLAVQTQGLRESRLGVVVFPELAAVVEEDSGDEKVGVQVGVDCADRGCGTHHLGDMFDQATAARVMVPFGGGSDHRIRRETFGPELAGGDREWPRKQS